MTLSMQVCLCIKIQDCYKNPPDSIALMALALASSRAVTQRCLSTSFAALIWNVCVPPLDMTNVQESTVWIRAPWRLIVPRQVCAISAWFLQPKNLHKYQIECTFLLLNWFLTVEIITTDGCLLIYPVQYLQNEKSAWLAMVYSSQLSKMIRIKNTVNTASLLFSLICHLNNNSLEIFFKLV